jgi:AbrB family looped-hinge helix DNA binding protein
MITKVTRGGRVRVPLELRKKYRMREGTKVVITETEGGLLLKLILSMNDWAGADAGKYTYAEMVEKLDRLRGR